MSDRFPRDLQYVKFSSRASAGVAIVGVLALPFLWVRAQSESGSGTAA